MAWCTAWPRVGVDGADSGEKRSAVVADTSVWIRLDNDRPSSTVADTALASIMGAVHDRCLRGESEVATKGSVDAPCATSGFMGLGGFECERVDNDSLRLGVCGKGLCFVCMGAAQLEKVAPY
eukprot:Opistho-2@74507